MHDRPTMTPEELRARVEGRVVGEWLLAAAEEEPDQVALRWRTGEDAEGQPTWGERTWAEVLDHAARIAGTYRSWGIGPGGTVALLLTNRPEFSTADLGAVLVRAKAVSIYASSSPEQIAYLLGHMGAQAVICDDIGYLERVLKVRDELPLLEHVVVVDDPDDVRPADVALFDELLAGDPVDAREAVASARPDDIVTLIYTSGTTGTPKGVILDHTNIAAAAEAYTVLAGVDLSQRRRGLSYLPMAHIAERMVSHYGWLWQRNVVTCVPDPAQLAAYLPATRPQVLFGPPRVWEKLRAAVLAGVASRGGDAVQRFEEALQLGQRVAALRAAGQEVPADLAERHAAVDAAAFAPVRRMLGLDELHFGFAGAAPLPTHVFDFWRGVGVPFSEIYGMSENTGGMTWDPTAVKQGTVGRPYPGVEVRLAEDGEVLCRGPIVTRGYFEDPERTAEAFDADGWLHTGDVGRFDEDGYLSIIDRKKELIITAGGKNVSPAGIEAELKSLPLIGQACVIGDDRPYLTALLVLDPDVAPGWAAARGVGGSLQQLAGHPVVQEEVARGVAEVNERFSRVEQIKTWALLGDEWLPDSPQLTATMKLKRRGVHAAYGDVIDSLYEGG